MNYNRRATRPDGLYYREARKVRPGRRGRTVRAGTALVVVALIVVAIYWFVR
jgi:hypothetical protein